MSNKMDNSNIDRLEFDTYRSFCENVCNSIAYVNSDEFIKTYGVEKSDKHLLILIYQYVQDLLSYLDKNKKSSHES